MTQPVTSLEAGITMIDTEMVGIDSLVAAFVVPGDRPAVIETGPATVTDTLTDRLVHLGYGPNDIAYFVMSHIHLDHAGAAGDILDRFPNATVVVHEAGARHMADPSR
ncbi:MAG: MBL fold metallo-hydrolase, partial [Acidimicrobiia bacterium]|nr:MBL fold metallo-hydrolase [Acidimicrobiia bacterium]